MHQSAYHWLQRTTLALPARRAVLEFGSRNVNGSPRSLFTHADRYYGIDIVPGDGVDEVADAATFTPADPAADRFDTIVCMEVLEHTDKARDICRNAYHLLARGGVALITAAGVGRVPHSAADGGTLRDGEFYRNVTVADLRWWLSDFQLVMVSTEVEGDVYAISVKW